MKKTSLYIASIGLAAVALGSCDNELERPPMVVPTSDWTANMTIEDFKSAYWSTVEGTPQVVGLNEDGDSIIIKGRVCSTDESGNIFKYLMIQGETEALALSLDFYDIYESYKFGQEIYVNVTGLTIGGYSGLMCIGNGVDDRGRVARAAETVFTPHAQANGLPNSALVDTTTVTITAMNEAKATAEGLELWQSRLVRIDRVRFENAGEPFAVGTTSNNRYIIDEAGNRINVYNSTYADFKDELLPSGYGSVVGILSYFGTNWQILLNNVDGCIGFNGVSAPVFSPAAGTVEAGTAISITCPTEDAEIHYTLDGSNPTGSSTLYTEAIVINETTTIKAIATKKGCDASPVVTAQFVVSDNTSGEAIFAETFLNSDLGQFTATVETSGSWTGWRANTNNPICAIANSYVNGANEAATAWLVSPEISLANVTKANIRFEQAYGFYFPTEQGKFCTVNVREKGGEWKALKLTVFPEKGTGNWTGWVENTLDISEFAGKTIEIGFKYVNDGAQSIAWEIRNLTVE